MVGHFSAMENGPEACEFLLFEGECPGLLASPLLLHAKAYSTKIDCSFLVAV